MIRITVSLPRFHYHFVIIKISLPDKSWAEGQPDDYHGTGHFLKFHNWTIKNCHRESRNEPKKTPTKRTTDYNVVFFLADSEEEEEDRKCNYLASVTPPLFAKHGSSLLYPWSLKTRRIEGKKKRLSWHLLFLRFLVMPSQSPFKVVACKNAKTLRNLPAKSVCFMSIRCWQAKHWIGGANKRIDKF